MDSISVSVLGCLYLSVFNLRLYLLVYIIVHEIPYTKHTEHRICYAKNAQDYVGHRSGTCQ